MFNDPADEMKVNINVLGSSMILVVLSQCDGRVIAREHCGRE